MIESSAVGNIKNYGNFLSIKNDLAWGIERVAVWLYPPSFDTLKLIKGIRGSNVEVGIRSGYGQFEHLPKNWILV